MPGHVFPPAGSPPPNPAEAPSLEPASTYFLNRPPHPPPKKKTMTNQTFDSVVLSKQDSKRSPGSDRSSRWKPFAASLSPTVSCGDAFGGDSAAAKTLKLRGYVLKVVEANGVETPPSSTFVGLCCLAYL